MLVSLGDSNIHINGVGIKIAFLQLISNTFLYLRAYGDLITKGHILKQCLK